MNALGMVEVYGFTTAICCADIAAKTADVKIIALDTTKPANAETAQVPLVMIVKMEGSVSAVTAGVAAAKAHAKERGLYIVSHIIPRPGPDIDKLAFLSKVGKDPIGKKAKRVMPKEKPLELTLKSDIKPKESKSENAETKMVSSQEANPREATPSSALKKRGRPRKTSMTESPS